jgi:hypothetical protein
VDEADAALVATELHRLIGHGLTPLKLKESLHLKSLVRDDLTEHAASAAIVEKIKSALDALTGQYYITALNRSLSAEEIRNHLSLLLRLGGSRERSRTAHNRRRQVLQALGLPTDDSTMDTWRHRPTGGEYQLMLVLARCLVRPKDDGIGYRFAKVDHGFGFKADHSLRFFEITATVVALKEGVSHIWLRCWPFGKQGVLNVYGRFGCEVDRQTWVVGLSGKDELHCRCNLRADRLLHVGDRHTLTVMVEVSGGAPINVGTIVSAFDIRHDNEARYKHGD